MNLGRSFEIKKTKSTINVYWSQRGEFALSLVPRIVDLYRSPQSLDSFILVRFFKTRRRRRSILGTSLAEIKEAEGHRGGTRRGGKDRLADPFA